MFKLIKQLRNFCLRKLVYRNYRIGTGFHAGLRVRLWAKNKLVIGNNFYIGRDSFIETNCIIGDNVIFGNKVAVVGKYDHNFQQIGTPVRLAMAIRDADYSWRGKDIITRIGNDVWVGYGSTIMQGVNIQDGCVIAAGSVVTKDTEAYTIYAGNPARKIRMRFNSEAELVRHIKILKH